MKNGVFWNIMIPKPGKNLSEVKSYGPITFLPIVSKLYEKLTLKRLKPISADKQCQSISLVSEKNHSTIEQVHRITDIIENTLENKGVCSAVFLDIA
jgi:hypothetical protein